MKSLSKITLLTAFLAAQASIHAQTTGFNQTAAGPWDYDTTGNWVGGTINGIWDSSLTLTAAQIVTFDSDLVLSTGVTFGYTGNHALTLRGDGSDRTITLGGNITVNPVSNQTVTLGSATAGERLNVNLGGDRVISVGTSKTLRFYNTISGGNLAIIGNNSATAGGGTMILTGDMAAAGSSAISLSRGALLSFDNGVSGSAGTTRAQSLELAGGALAIAGNAGTSSTETIAGALTVAPGHSFNSITLTTGAGTHLQLNADSLGRTGTGAVLFRGTDLGVNSIASATANSSNIAFTTAPTAQLVGGALGTKGAGILPWAIVDTSASGLGSSFATYDVINGIRALTASEYSTTIATDGSTTGHNIKLTATGSPLTVNGASTVNSLFVDVGATGAQTALNGTGSLTITSGAVFINIASMTGSNGATVDIAKNIDFGSTQGVIGTSSSGNQRRVSFSGGISGSGGVVFYDTGLNTNQATGIYLNSANSYTGNTFINGTVSVPVNNALPNFTNNSRTGDVYLNGVLKLITTNGVVQINGLWGEGTVYSQYTNANKTLAVGDNNATSTFGGRLVVDGNSGSMNLRKVGTGVLTLTGTSSNYTGVTSVQNGTLEVVTLNNIAAPNATSSLGRPTSVSAGTIGLGNSTTTGALKVTGTGETTDRVINLAGTTGGAVLEQAGTGVLEFTSDFTATGNGIKSLTLQGSTAGTGKISGAIVNGASATSLIKNGSGMWDLSGANTYTGGTTVNAGTLLVNGSLSATGNVNVTAGTLGGSGDGTTTGVIGGATTLAAGAKLSPGSAAGLAGNLTFSNGLDLSASSNDTGAYLFNLGSVAASDKITLTSGTALALNVGTLDTTDFTFTTGVGFGAGTYVLFDASSAIAGSVGTGVYDFGGGFTGTLSIDSLNNDVLLTVVPEPSTTLMMGMGLALVLWRSGRRVRG